MFRAKRLTCLRGSTVINRIASNAHQSTWLDHLGQRVPRHRCSRSVCPRYRTVMAVGGEELCILSLRFLCPLKQNGGLRGGNGGLRAGLCQENGIEHELVVCNIMAGENKTPEFLKMNPMHCIPTMVCFIFLEEDTWRGRSVHLCWASFTSLLVSVRLGLSLICSPSIRSNSHLIRPTLAQEDDGYTMWESKAILRYICNKHKLEQWYPTDCKKRGTCDLALDHFNVWVTEIAYKLLYPAAGFAPPVEDSVMKAAEVGRRTPRCICIRAILRACWLCRHVCIGGV